MAIDILDSQLIELLMQNANLSSGEIAGKLNVSSSTIRRRIKNLTEEGVIRIVAVPDLYKIGLPVVAFISFEVSHEKIKSVLERLSKHPNAVWVGATSGRFNVRSVWWLNSTEALYTIIESEIGKIEGILRTETSISLQIEKREINNIKNVVDMTGQR